MRRCCDWVDATPPSSSCRRSGLPQPHSHSRTDIEAAGMSRWHWWRRLHALGTLATMGFQADAPAALVVATMQPFDLAGGALQALALKGLADTAAARDLRGTAVAAVLLALVTAGRYVASTGWLAAKLRLGERAGMLMQRRLGALTAAIPTIEHFERP